MNRIKILLKEFRALRISLSLKFIIGTGLALSIIMSISIYFISANDKKLVMEQVNMQAKALFKQIVLTRRWIADHGGIFVENVPWKDPNPYLSEPEILDVMGRKYIKESPAMVTKELSKYAEKEGLFWFHITSLKLTNPDNAPDEFERTALMKFERENTTEFSKIERIGSSHFYRYIAPLNVEKSCLKCHSHQEYKVGDIRGAISITVPMDHILSMLNSEKRNIILASIVTISILMLILYIMMRTLVLDPVNQLKSSMNDFSGGKKTETSVIRTGDELESLSRSFVEMSRSLAEYHSHLQEKVHAATKSLEDANARLTHLNIKKSDFIAKVSHELRTPLTSIKGAMDYISAKISREADNFKEMSNLMTFFDLIKNNADRLIRMVNDTLDLERIESGVFDMHLSQVNMLSLIKEVVISFESITSEKKITFKLISSDPGIAVTVDEDRARQVLINIISNAIEFSPGNAEIQIIINRTDKAVAVSIENKGRGIPADEQKKIFDKFYTKGTKNGTGLGLAICKGIIEAHGGEINVSSDGEDKGCTFSFTLPKRKRVT